MDELNLFLETLRRFWVQLVSFLPQLLASLLVMIAGWIVARIFRKALGRLLRLLRVDEFAEKTGIDGFLIQGGVKYTTSTLIAGLVYWFIILVVPLAVISSLGLPAAAELFNKVLLFVPKVFVAIFVLMLGSLFARLIKVASLAYLNNIGISGAEIVSTIAQWAIIVFVISMALEQLALGGQILISAFQIAFGAFCLALALAFGLGGREWAAKILENLWKRSA